MKSILAVAVAFLLHSVAAAPSEANNEESLEIPRRVVKR